MYDKQIVSNLLNFNPDDAVAIHGTSIEAVEILLKTGYLPSSDTRWRHLSPDNMIDYIDGHLYLVPIKDKFKQFSFHSEIIMDFKPLYDDVLFYAHFIASRNYIVSHLDFEPSDDPSSYLTPDGWYYPCAKDEKPLLLSEAEEHGMTESELQQILDDLFNIPSGILLYMSSKLLTLPINSPCDDEISIDLPNGLSLDYVLGIKPLGNYENNILRDIVSG